MEAKGSKRRRVATIFCKSSSSRCPLKMGCPAVARVFSRNGGGGGLTVNCARRQRRRARRDVSGSKNGRRSRTNDVGYGAARLGRRGGARAREFGRSRPCRGDFAMFEPAILPGRRELQYSCDLCGELPISCKRWCCDVCEDFGARANPVNRARIPLPRVPSRPDQLTQLLTRISFETTGANRTPPAARRS